MAHFGPFSAKMGVNWGMEKKWKMGFSNFLTKLWPGTFLYCIFGPTPTGRIRTYEFGSVSVCRRLSVVVCRVLEFFSETAHWTFLIFFFEKRKKLGKKVTFSLFRQKFEKCPFFALIWSKWAILAENRGFSHFFRKPRIGFA